MSTQPKSYLEAAFACWWRILAQDLPQPQRNYRFDPSRRFRFDYAWPDELVAVELEGGTWIRGRHVRGRGFERDCQKYNLAALYGWTVLRFTSNMLDDDPEGCITQVRRALTDEDETVCTRANVEDQKRA